MPWPILRIRYRDRSCDGRHIRRRSFWLGCCLRQIGYDPLGRLTHLNFRAYHLRLGVRPGTLLWGVLKVSWKDLGATISKDPGSIDLWIRKNWSHSKNAWRRGSKICVAL